MEVGENVLDPLLIERPLPDPKLTSHQQCWPYRADRNSGRLLTTSNTQLTECQVEPPDSCRPMMQITPWLHALWPCPLGLCLLAYKPLWRSQRSICWYGFSWCHLWLDSNGWRAVDGPPGFFLYPLDIAWVVWTDITFSLVHPGWNEPYLGLWSIREPVTVAGSWPKNPASGNKVTNFGARYFLFRIHTCQMRHLAHGDTIVVALKPMLTGTLFSSSAILDQRCDRKYLPLSSTSDANGGLINADRTKCRSHLGMIQLCTSCSSLNALMSSLMCGSTAGSYFQWCSTEATDVRCEMMVDGSNPMVVDHASESVVFSTCSSVFKLLCYSGCRRHRVK